MKKLSSAAIALITIGVVVKAIDKHEREFPSITITKGKTYLNNRKLIFQ